MSKTQVYSWRLEPDLKERLEQAAREERLSLGGLLERIARDWLGGKRPNESKEELQRRLHAQAEKAIGTIRSGDPHGSERVKERFREYVTEKHKRRAAKGAD